MTNAEINQLVRDYLSLPYSRRIHLAKKLDIRIEETPYETDAIEWTRLILTEAKKMKLLQQLWDLARAERQMMP